MLERWSLPDDDDEEDEDEDEPLPEDDDLSSAGAAFMNSCTMSASWSGVAVT